MCVYTQYVNKNTGYVNFVSLTVVDYQTWKNLKYDDGHVEHKIGLIAKYILKSCHSILIFSPKSRFFANFSEWRQVENSAITNL